MYYVTREESTRANYCSNSWLLLPTLVVTVVVIVHIEVIIYFSFTIVF